MRSSQILELIWDVIGWSRDSEQEEIHETAMIVRPQPEEEERPEGGGWLAEAVEQRRAAAAARELQELRTTLSKLAGIPRACPSVQISDAMPLQRVGDL